MRLLARTRRKMRSVTRRSHCAEGLDRGSPLINRNVPVNSGASDNATKHMEPAEDAIVSLSLTHKIK